MNGGVEIVSPANRAGLGGELEVGKTLADSADGRVPARMVRLDGTPVGETIELYIAGADIPAGTYVLMPWAADRRRMAVACRPMSTTSDKGVLARTFDDKLTPVALRPLDEHGQTGILARTTDPNTPWNSRAPTRGRLPINCG